MHLPENRNKVADIVNTLAFVLPPPSPLAHTWALVLIPLAYHACMAYVPSGDGTIAWFVFPQCL